MKTPIDKVMAARQNAAFAEHMKNLLTERGLSKTQFVKMVHGTRENGQTRGSHGFAILSGKAGASTATIALWAEKLGVAASDLQPAAVERPRNLKARRAPREQSRELVVHNPIEQKLVNGNSARNFSLTTDEHGRACFTLTLADVPLAEALRAVNLLTNAGVLKG
jgi:hypothetical protein